MRTQALRKLGAAHPTPLKRRHGSRIHPHVAPSLLRCQYRWVGWIGAAPVVYMAAEVGSRVVRVMGFETGERPSPPALRHPPVEAVCCGIEALSAEGVPRSWGLANGVQIAALGAWELVRASRSAGHIPLGHLLQPVRGRTSCSSVAAPLAKEGCH